MPWYMIHKTLNKDGSVNTTQPPGAPPASWLGRLALVGLLLGCFSVRASAQQLQLNVDPAVDQLMKNWVSLNRSNPGIEGWRLQLLSTTDRQRVEAGKSQFLSLYPTVPADWVHEKPYYKLRVGAFLTRQEAMSFLVEIKDAYPGAYPARDANIHPRDFLE
ncbi:MAG: SPOR domain-containing protein [Saprospirales bacterium]|nr:SPOR domain-containing protein [Saprospirales bacterium]